MSLTAALGTSTDPSTEVAVRDAVNTAKSKVPSPKLAIVTATVDRSPEELLSNIRAHLPSVPIHGATTCAAVLTTTGPLPNGVGVLLLDTPGVATASAPLAGGTPAEAAMRVAESLKDSLGDIAHVILAASPGIEEQVLSALSEALPGVKIFGGSAADNTVAGEWALLTTENAFGEGISAVGIAPGVAFGSCLLPPYRQGPVSAKITKAQGRTIYELDGRRAADVLREWVGDSVDTQSKGGGSVIVECAAFPLGVERVSEGWVGIHAAQIGEDGSIGLFAEVAEGDVLTVMMNMGDSNSTEAARIGLEKAYDQAAINGGLEDPKAGIMIYCGGLSIAVGDGLATSLEAMKGRVPLLGMTAFGEQGYIQGCNVHSNLAVGIALFG